MVGTVIYEDSDSPKRIFGLLPNSQLRMGIVTTDHGPVKVDWGEKNPFQNNGRWQTGANEYSKLDASPEDITKYTIDLKKKFAKLGVDTKVCEKNDWCVFINPFY